MIRTIRLHFARRAAERSSAEYVAYQRQPAGGAWSHGVAMALHAELIRRERILCRIANASR